MKDKKFVHEVDGTSMKDENFSTSGWYVQG